MGAVKLGIVLLFCLAGSVRALTLDDLHNGDVVLLPLNCQLCTAITEETGSEFSHSGVLVKNEQGEWGVLEALGSVRRVSLREFLKRAPTGKQAAVYRPIDFRDSWPTSPELMGHFQAGFAGKSFDHEFLWDNQDEKGESFYCSEFVSKFLAPFMETPLAPLPMSFTRHWAFWFNYFKGNVPQGMPGLSPEDIARSALFTLVGRADRTFIP